MTEKLNGAFGHPGIEPRWTQGSKDGIGTAYAASCHVWFTLWNGILTEVYYPTVDRPQIRDLQFLITDGESFFHEEKRHLKSRTERLCPSLAYRLTNDEPEGRYRIEKTVITDPHLPVVLQHVCMTGDAATLEKLKFYVLCAPHLEVGGWGNNARTFEVAGRRIFVVNKRSERGETWMAMAANIPFRRMSCGYSGTSDGWQDLEDNFQMDWEFERAADGNVALTAEIMLDKAHETESGGREFTLGVAFGDAEHAAITALAQALSIPFDAQLEKFLDQWERPAVKRLPLEKSANDGGNLYRASYSLLHAHEDKRYPGAMIASLSIPWGQMRGDEDTGGYHLVWTRDMTNSALGLLAAGNRETPLRALIYLATSQNADGGFAQNFNIDGTAHQDGKQFDQVAYPILLARRLHRENALQKFDPYLNVIRAAQYIVRQGPVTGQERWEEISGISPSTLAVCIAALVAASCFASEREDEATAQFLAEYADWLESRVEAWTTTDSGTFFEDVKRYFVRINPLRQGEPLPDRLDENATVSIANRAPDEQRDFPAKEIVDAGFLELVRYGIRRADDPLVVDSLRVTDSVLKVETEFGIAFRRYNNDGYGQRADGTAFDGWGQGRAWILLGGERGHYEIAAGGDAAKYLHSMEGFALPTGLLSEQVWDAADLPEAHMFTGKSTGAAMPLAWAHAEYLKLIRSISDGEVFDQLPEVAARYTIDRRKAQKLQIWSFGYQTQTRRAGERLRVLAAKPFRLRWSADEWQTINDVASAGTALEVDYADVEAGENQTIRFTFFWMESETWEGRDFEIAVESDSTNNVDSGQK